MDTTRCLREEHQVILRVLDCFEAALGTARRTGRVERAAFAPFVEFFRDFADRCHHCKEEDRLFPCLERCGMPRDAGPIAVMLSEHRQGRAHVREIAAALDAADAGDAAASGAVLEHGAAFLDLLRHHIMKEDHVLFEMADHVVDAPKRLRLATDYAEADAHAAPTLGRGRALAAALCAQYGVPPPPPPPPPP